MLGLVYGVPKEWWFGIGIYAWFLVTHSIPAFWK